MRMFLTGSTGFIGSHVVASALQKGWDVRALRRPGSLPRIPLQQEPEWLEGPMTSDWSEALSGCDVFLHLAAYGVAKGGNNWKECFAANVTDSLALWLQAYQAGVRRFVICGSCFEFGQAGERYAFIPVDAPLMPTTAYGSSKAAATVAALGFAIQHGLELVVARPFHVYGPGEDMARFWPSLCAAAESGQDFPMTLGEQVRDFTPVSDAAAAFLDLADPACVPLTAGEPQLRNIGTGKPMSLAAFASQEWARCGGTGELQLGSVPYRPNEVMQYVPEIQG